MVTVIHCGRLGTIHRIHGIHSCNFSSKLLNDEIAEDGSHHDGRGQRGHEDAGRHLPVLVPGGGLGPEHHGHVVDVAVGEGEQDHDHGEGHVAADVDLRGVFFLERLKH